MGAYGITEEDRRLENKAKTILLDLLKWLESCYEIKNVVAAEVIWQMIISILKEMMDFAEGDFGRGDKHNLFNSLIDLHRGFFKKDVFIPSLDLECRWLKELVLAGGGEEYPYDKYVYQWAWELLKPVHKEVLSSIEDGLLLELDKRVDGHKKFFSHFRIYFYNYEIPKRNLRSSRSFFLFIQRDIKLKYGPKSMRVEAVKMRSLIRKGLEFYPAKKRNI